MFALLTVIQKDVDLVWHYNEAHHGKGPMDGIGGTIKSKVFRRVLSNEVVINNPREFVEFADSICNVDCLYLPDFELLEEPEFVQDVTPIPETLKTHKIIRCYTKHGVAYNKFYYVSSDQEQHFQQWYGLSCGHAENDTDGNTCAYCLKKYNKKERVP